ncbi:hypothetical protein BH10ACT9_BH10ACT9_26340 [soil metagenome]
MKSLVQRIPFPFLGYLFILVGFAGLGLFVGALGFGMPGAPYLGVGTVAAYAIGVSCFLYRGHQMRTADPSDTTVLHFDPMVPDGDRRNVVRYLRTYRGLTVPEASASAGQTPTVSPPARRHRTVPARSAA